MKKYALFAGDNYYPDGGAGDFAGWFDSIDDAKRCADAKRVDYSGWDSINLVDCWAHIALAETMQILEWGFIREDKPIEWQIAECDDE